MVSNSDIEVPQKKELIYSDPQADVIETTADRVLMHCGVGSGKSQVIGVLSADFVLNNPELIGFIGANTYSQLSKSTLARVFNVWETEFGLIKDVHFVVDLQPPPGFIRMGPDQKDYSNIISFENGAMIFVASLDNYKVIDGVEFGYAFLDETKDTREVAVKEVIIARLRQKGVLIDSKGVIHKTRRYNHETGKIDDILHMKLQAGVWTYDSENNKYFTENGLELTGYNPLYIFTSPAKTKWLSDWFHLDDEAEEIAKHIFDKDDYYRKRTGRQLVVISSSYHNQHNLPPGYIEGMIDDLAGNEGLIDMLIYGSPFGKSGGEFVTTYSRLQHVKDFEPWPDAAVHLSFDFNLVPYITCTCWQIKQEENGRYKVRAFAEFCLPNPKNNSESLCEEIITYYEHLLKNGVLYYGDYNGNTETTVGKNLRSNYEAIKFMLMKYLDHSSKRVIPNQGLEKRRRFTNKLFKGALPIDIEIHKSCKELRGDLEFCKEGPDGGVLKSEVTKDGRKYQDRGHCLDSLQYFFTSAFDMFFNV